MTDLNQIRFIEDVEHRLLMLEKILTRQNELLEQQNKISLD